ncbi:MAG: DUF3088 domain-containing protein [Planctomycetales bacterium]|nr:DUF3088 domain-containing protein [Planctomycetales bacterium]
MRDILFVLKEEFPDGPGRPYFCPHCAEISGVLSYFPKLRHHLDIRYAEFARPRTEIVQMIGEPNQNCPVLILSGQPSMDAMEFMTGQHSGRYFVSGPREIAEYWSHVYGIPRPH